jgi:2-oxoglutarate ferredoxin oxidoreductase subunit beta
VAKTPKKSKRQATDYETSVFPTWCPGCGDYSIWASIKQSLAELDIPPHQLNVIYGIGCSGNMCSFVNAYGFHALHGRSLPAAIGAKLANPELPTLIVNGDGDNYGEGMNHWINSMRGNHDLTHIVHDNMIYGLTTGQASPTSQEGMKTKTTPDGDLDQPVNPIVLALEMGATFVARGFAGDHEHLTELIKQGVNHKGYAFIDVFQPCVTYNHQQTYEWYRERIYKLEDQKHYDTSNKRRALDEAHVFGNRIPTGLFYQEERPVYHEELTHVKEPLVKNPLKPNLPKLIKEFL